MKLFKNVAIEAGTKKPKLPRTKKTTTPVVEEVKEEENKLIQFPTKEVEEEPVVQPEVETPVEDVEDNTVLETPKEEEAVLETTTAVKTLKEQVSDFICEFFKEDASGKMIDTFANEKSYWFARILFLRFQHYGAVLMYDVATDLFYMWACGGFYNSYGLCEVPPEQPVSWDTWTPKEDIAKELYDRHIALNLK